jgi:hypothetical protein
MPALHSASGRRLLGLIEIAERGGVRFRLDVTASEDLAMTLEEFEATSMTRPARGQFRVHPRVRSEVRSRVFDIIRDRLVN